MKGRLVLDIEGESFRGTVWSPIQVQPMTRIPVTAFGMRIGTALVTVCQPPKDDEDEGMYQLTVAVMITDEEEK